MNRLMSRSPEPFKAVEARGRAILASEQHARSARYDEATGRVIVDLVNGCACGFPARFVQDLHDADPADLAAIEVDGVGINLHWPRLDVDLYVPALVGGTFGTREWMALKRRDPDD